ncbi:GEVED domain-containing protein [Prolixibacteraceae bacterium Z1-6]|uniref:GEVED domain-containing protein n=1 Tax=Draconibacterium aestuarii TaxID=2998507 RepID=A0A9X3J6X2_9BACT|nr:GEVED domain-containing protein [Prolixibacteraceae bacterium Z1-6]
MKTKFILTLIVFTFLYYAKAQTMASIEMQCPPNIEEDCGSYSELPLIETYEDFINLGGAVTSECRIIEESFTLVFIDSIFLEDIGRMDYFQDFSIEDSCGNIGYCSFYYSKPVEFILPEDIYASNYCGTIDNIFELSGLPLSLGPSPISTEEFIRAGGYVNEFCDQLFYAETQIEYSDQFLQDENLTCQSQLIRTFTFFNPFNNYTKTMEQYIGIFDYEDPVLVQAPKDTTVYGYYNAAVIFETYQQFVDAGGIVTDNCNIDESAFEIIGSDTHGYCPFIITKYYGVYDECGNRVSVKHTTYAYDTIPPEIRCPSDITVSCMSDVPQPYFDLNEFQAAGGWLFDVSGIQSFRFVSESIEGNNPKIVTYTYEVTDNCGNSATCEQNISITDVIPPVASCPVTQVDCIDEVPPVFVELYDFLSAGGTVSDNCEIDTTYFQLINEITVGSCPKEITRTYEVADFSGNTSTFNHTIHVIDTIPPAFVGIPDLYFECIDDVPPPYDYYSFIAAGGDIFDNCAVNHKINLFVSESWEGACPAILKRIYEVEDSCGNVGTWIHTITVNDTVPPTISAPASIADIEFGSELPEFEQLGFDDNCGVAQLTTTILPYTPDESGYEVSYVWTAIDECGNSTAVSASFNVLPQAITYCEPNLSAASEWIAGVAIDDQSNTTTTGGGYEDFSANTTFNLFAAGSHTITLTPGFEGKANFEYWAVWIDYNGDGEFTDDEKVFSATKKRSLVTGTINIPDVEDMETRMRVALSPDGALVSCAQSGNGEVEDYTVTISAAQPQAPVAAFSSDKTTVVVGGSIQFTDESANNPTTRLWSFSGGNPENSTEATPTVTYNTAGTYDVTLTDSNEIGSDSYTSQISVTDEPAPEYCTSYSLSGSKEWIAGVLFGTINNSSGATTYSDFTAQTTTLSVGESAAINLSPGFSKNALREYWKVWIDFNHDSDFEDAGEEVFAAPNVKGDVSGNIVVPANAIPGTTRMRVAMKAAAFSTPCEIFDRGEVEDYSLIIEGTKSIQLDVAETDVIGVMRVYPNPAQEGINVETGVEQSVSVMVFDIAGNLLLAAPIEKTGYIDLSAFAEGTYLVKCMQQTKRIIKMK